jgi:DNA-binding HxlR family transcriptional regulator
MIDFCTNNEAHLGDLVERNKINKDSKETAKARKVKSSAITLVIKHLLVQPHTSASLVQKIGIYSSSHISHCLRKLKKAGLIGAVWDFQKVGLVYYNLKLEEDEQANE